MSSIQKPDSLVLLPNTSNPGIVTRTLHDTQNLPSNSPRKTTTQNLLLDGCDTFAGTTPVTYVTDVLPDSSITEVINKYNPFSDWSKGELLKFLTSTCPDVFDISNWWDKQEILIKEFANQHFMNIESARELRYGTANMKGEHERYKYLAKQLASLCVEMNKLSKDWWKEAAKHNRRITDEISEDDKRYWEHIKPNLVQEECSLSIIGDTGAGKSSIINLLCEDSIMPTGVIKTTSGICEIRYSGTKCFSKKTKSSSVFETIELDFSLPSTTFSSALTKYVANQTSERLDHSSNIYKLEWPIELLNSGITIYDTPGFNDCSELTDIVTEHMKKCLVFLVVINCGLTNSLLKSMDQLKKLRISGKTLFCVVTHLDDKTVDQQNKALNDVKNEMLTLFPEFNIDNCIMLNPKKALHILKTYGVYEKNHFKFLQTFIPFLSQIFTLKTAELTIQIRAILERFNQFIQICYNFGDEEFRKSYKIKLEIENRRLDFIEAKARLNVKINSIAKDFNVKAVNEIVKKFLDIDFKRQFLEAAESIILPDDIMTAVNWDVVEKKLFAESNGEEYRSNSFRRRFRYKKKVIDEYELSFLSAIRVFCNKNCATSVVTTDAFKVYLQVQLISWIDQQMTILLSEMAEQTMDIIYQTCSDDLRIVNNAIQRRYQLLTQKSVHDSNTKERYSSILTPMITNHEKKFSGSIKVLVGIYTLGLALVGEQIHDLIKEIAERLYQRISDKLNKPNEQEELLERLDEDDSTFHGDILTHFERAFIDIEQLSQMQQVYENTEEWRRICRKYLNQCNLLELKIHNFQARNLLQWSLKANQLQIDEQSVVYQSIFDGSIVKYGSLKVEENNTLTSRVSIRSLHHQFNILHVCDETNINRLINHDNLLYCYGAYLSENIVHIVTEPYMETLEGFLCSGKQLETQNILQMSLQLTEAVNSVLEKIETEEMYNLFVLNTNSVMVTATSQIKLNVVANKADFLYRSPEDLFPRYVKNTPEASVSKRYSSIYALGLIYYRLCYRKEQEICYFKSGKWLLPSQDTMTIVDANYYTNFVEIYHEDQHFQFCTPMIDHNPTTISSLLKNLIKRCYSIDFIDRPALNVLISVLRSLLIMPNNEVINSIEVRSIMKNPINTPRIKYGLLSIDGGGTRGIIPATIIEYLEQKSGRNFWELFDLTAGCSTGGILALASMLRRAKGTELVTFYNLLAKKVFPFQRRLPTTEYSVKAFEKLLKKVFGQTMMFPQLHDPKTFVVTKRNTETKPFLLRNYKISSSKHQGDVGWKCSEAARATSAAPTYFKPFRKEKNIYSDGGVGFNNPVELLYDEALALLSSHFNDNFSATNECPIAYIVSIGTGKMPDLPVTDHNPSSFIRFRDGMQTLINQAADTENAHHRMETICQRLNIPYYRFNPQLKERAEVTETARLTDWYEQTRHYMDHNSEQINQLCTLFSERTCSMLCQSCRL